MAQDSACLTSGKPYVQGPIPPKKSLARHQAEIRRIIVRGQPREIVCENPISKITRAKSARDVAPAVEYLLCNTKPLLQTPVPPKK
jgi:hypothetical protein